MFAPTGAVVLGMVCFCLALPSGASAAPPEFLTRMPADGVPGGGAGQMDNPRGIAASPATGRVYVANLINSRIDEYTAWGLFVRGWGWNVAPDGAPGDTPTDQFEICGPTEPEEAPPPGLCQSGSQGSGVGQLNRPNGVAIDSPGDVYVADRDNLRVQKFDSVGQFKLMFGGKVNKTKVEAAAPAQQQNVCPVDPGDVCQAGSAGTAPSHLAATVGNYIAYSPAGGGAIVVGDKDRIQIFNLDGTYREELSFTGALAAFAGKAVNALDVDAAGNIYFSVGGLKDIYKVSAAGVPLTPGSPGNSQFKAEVPLGVAVDHKGNVYAIDDPPQGLIMPRVVKFDSAGTKLVPTQVEEEADEFFPYVPFQGPGLTGIATNFCPSSPEPGNLYVASFSFGKVAAVDAYGSGPDGCEPPPKRPPVIHDQYASSVGSESARVRAQINPKFWKDTVYRVEYGEGPCQAGGCTSEAPFPPALLTKDVTSKILTTGAVSIGNLKPATTYHYRFVAQSGGGGPVFGVDPDGDGPETASSEAGLEGTFKTMNVPSGDDECENDVFRKGPGAQLPDCRAYEMVSPLDKEGGDVALWIGKNAQAPHFFEINQSAPTGERFTFSSGYPFTEPEAAPFVSQYVAERADSGWQSRSISPPRSEIPIRVDNFESEFQGFSEDLCTTWIRHNSIAPLAEGAIPGFPNLYRRDNCAPGPNYEALSTVEPPHRDPDDYVRLVARGASSDSSHVIFTANDKLHEDAPVLPDEFEQLLYEATPGGLRFVCYLPGEAPSPGACGAGTAAASQRNAISADGSRIFWTAYTGLPGFGNAPGAPGQIYLRSGGAETAEVSGVVAPDPAWYWTAADDGSKAIFAFESGPHKDELYEFDVDSETATLIAEGVLGPMGASEDASRIYFASTEDLDGGGAAANGGRNLYLYDANAGGGSGAFTFVMVLAGEDIGGTDVAPAPIDEVPDQRAARVTPDGLHATFAAVAPPPSGYDNREAESGIPAQGVYRYDAEEGELTCVSCNPTGARPTGEQLETFPAAARIQGWEVLLHAPRVISDDGSRVFFESFEALVPRDTNGTWDVYQWEEPAKGTCGTKDATYSDETGGCVDLISSGESKAKSTFLDADPSGDNIFFSTQSSLVGQDYGLNDVYVARALGGFPEPPPETICEGDACQSPGAVPSPPSPSSSSYRQPPGVTSKPRRCPKGKRKVKRAGKVRCVKKRKAGKRDPSRRVAR